MTDSDRRLALHLLPGDLALDAVDGTGNRGGRAADDANIGLLAPPSAKRLC
jgi:hypothetical protein